MQISVADTVYQQFDSLCLDALHREADAWPKPGLVTPQDSGSHTDMDHACFMRSIAALRGYFATMVRAGERAADYPELQAIALRVEARMLLATQGANTHRGAIFNLGLLAAAAGVRRQQPCFASWTCGAIVAHLWGKAILGSRQQSSGAVLSHGETIWQRLGVGGAREEAASGFPHVYQIGLPTLRVFLEQGLPAETSLIATLMRLMEALPDTNLLWRGGVAGLTNVQTAARRFNQQGGVLQADWRQRLVAMHEWMVAENLSPGGSADLVAATWLALQLESVERVG